MAPDLGINGFASELIAADDGNRVSEGLEQPSMVGDYYMYPGYVDHNGLFYVNCEQKINFKLRRNFSFTLFYTAFMPNSFDPYGQPIVMMPYAATSPDPAFVSDSAEVTEAVANAGEGGEPVMNGEERITDEGIAQSEEEVN